MKTFRKPVCTLVVVLTAVIGYLGVWPGNLQAAYPIVDGPWNTNRGNNAHLTQNHNLAGGARKVTGWFIGPYGRVALDGGWDLSGTLLTLTVIGVRYNGTVNLQPTPVIGPIKEMKGRVYLDGLLPIRWTWTRP